MLRRCISQDWCRKNVWFCARPEIFRGSVAEFTRQPCGGWLRAPLASGPSLLNRFSLLQGGRGLAFPSCLRRTLTPGEPLAPVPLYGSPYVLMVGSGLCGICRNNNPRLRCRGCCWGSRSRPDNWRTFRLRRTHCRRKNCQRCTTQPDRCRRPHTSCHRGHWPYTRRRSRCRIPSNPGLHRGRGTGRRNEGRFPSCCTYPIHCNRDCRCRASRPA